MHFAFLLPIWALVAFVLFKIVSVVVQKRRYAAHARQHGCQDAPALPDQGFLGMKQIKQMQDADKKQMFPDLLVERHLQMSQLHGRVCSTTKWYVFGQTLYFTSDPENIKALLASQFADFSLGPSRRGNMMATLGDGIFVQDGKKWEHSRALLRPNFVREQVSDLVLEERHVQDLLKVIPIHDDGWTAETNLQTLFFRLTLDTATEFLFGESVNSLLAESTGVMANTTDEKTFSFNFDNAQLHLAKRFRLGDMYWMHSPKEFHDNNKVVKKFVRHYVDLALRQGAVPTDKKSEASGEKAKYVFLEELARQTRDPEELSAQIVNILAAGRDTTASLLSWLFHELLRNPEVFTKLRRTIIDTFGTYDAPQDISFATLKGCNYLQCCLNETLRKWPVVPSNARRSNKATTLPRGGGPDGNSPIFLPPQTDVLYSVHVLMRRQDLWGADAESFVPERFIGRRLGWDYLPFNGGPRLCIGQQFALTEASYVVVRLLQKFDAIQARPETMQGPVTSNVTLTSCPGQPVTLWLHEAKE